MKHALIIENRVANIIEWDGQAELSLPYRIIRSDDAQMGDIYDESTNSFSKPDAESLSQGVVNDYTE